MAGQQAELGDNRDINQPIWRLTKPGRHILGMVSSGPMFGMRMIDEEREPIQDEGYDGAFHV